MASGAKIPNISAKIDHYATLKKQRQDNMLGDGTKKTSVKVGGGRQLSNFSLELSLFSAILSLGKLVSLYCWL